MKAKSRLNVQVLTPNDISSFLKNPRIFRKQLLIGAGVLVGILINFQSVVSIAFNQRKTSWVTTCGSPTIRLKIISHYSKFNTWFG